MDKTWTILELINETTAYFKKKGIDTARLDAELLLAHCLNKERIHLYLSFDQPVTPDELSSYRELVRRRAEGEPVAYLIGYREFWSLKIRVSQGMLIPRPETEMLVEEAVKILKPADADSNTLHILELGTGSGAISLALAKELQNLSVYATDVSPTALHTALTNARHYGYAQRIAYICGHSLTLFKPRELFDMVISNPPYIRRADIAHLAKEIKNHEPLEALNGGEDGLRFYREWIPLLPALLKKGAWVLFEMGDKQSSAITQEFIATDMYTPVKIVKDYAGHERVILAQKK
jgi:release factor glutamine methyltransferase